MRIEEIEDEVEDEIHGGVQMMVEDERTHAFGDTNDLFQQAAEFRRVDHAWKEMVKKTC